MLRPALVYFVSVLCFGQGRVNAEPAPPFWRAKEKYFARVRAGEPIVSVATRATEGSNRRLTIVGGGRVKATRAVTYAFAKKLDRVAATSGFVENARMNDQRNRLHLIFKALGRRAEFDVGVKADDDRHRVSFDILGGPLVGLTATLPFTEVGSRETEVAIDGHYDYRSFPLKGTLLTVGMEALFKTMAERLRDAVLVEAKTMDKAAPDVEHSAAKLREH